MTTQTAGTTNGGATATAAPPSQDQVNAGNVKALLEEVIRETSRNQILVTDTPAVQQFKMYRAKARLYAESGLFKLKDGDPNKAIAQAFTLIEIGASMGFGEAISMQGIAIVSNRPVLGSQMLATRMQELGYDWDPYFWHNESGECIGCQIFMKYKGQPMMRPQRNPDGTEKRNAKGEVLLEQASVRFTAQDALRMQLQENEYAGGQKTGTKLVSLAERQTYKSFTEDMFFARCLTRAQKRFVAKALVPGVLTQDQAEDMGLYRANASDGVIEGTPDTAAATLEQRIAEETAANPQPDDATESATEVEGEPAEEERVQQTTAPSPQQTGGLFGNAPGMGGQTGPQTQTRRPNGGRRSFE
jgi:hypothetical protein